MKNAFILALFYGVACTAFADFTCSVKVAEGEVGVSRTATTTYAGGGSSAPLVRVEADDGAYVRFSEADGWAKSVEFLALGGDGTQDFFCLADNKDAKLELSYTVGSSEAIPWATLGASLKPSYVSEDAWAYAEQELESRLGATWNAYLARLKANADYLADLGYVTKRTDRLLALEINRALGVNAAVPTLASATDISRSARGLPLAFSRSFSSAMYAHFKCGALGYGWTDNYSLYAELVDETTLAIRLPSGGSYSFSKVTGAWQPEDARDVTKLTETSDAYVLTYENGMVQTFAKSNMRLKTIADNVGNTLTFAWKGTQLQSVTHSDGQKLTFAYNADGLISSVTDDLGNQVSYTYDANRQLNSVTGTDGLVTTYEYFAEDDIMARALKRITYPDKTTLDFMYVTTGTHLALDSITPSAHGTTSFYYPDVGTIQISSPDGGVTEVAMGPSGEVLKATDAIGNVVTRTYDGDGLLKSILAPSGKSGQYAYDARGRVTTHTSAAGNKTTFDYTELFGNLKTLKDAKNQSVSYGYDDKGRATSVTFPDGAKMLVAYNEKGDVAKTTNCRGQSETYGYDAEGRVTSRTWANGRTFTYAYDAKGRLVTATDSVSGKVTMTYDDGDRLTKITYPNSKGFTFTYDAAGRLTKHTAVDGTAECYAYDSAGRVSEVTDGNGGLYVRNTYDATTGRLSVQTYGNGTSTSYLYDLCDRITSIAHKDAVGKITESLQYCYDEDGRCIRAASLLGEERYTYDDDGQLTGVTYPVGENESFAYDAAGNRTSANGATYTVNKLNQYTAFSTSTSTSTSLTYDADGNLTSKTDSTGTTTYTYDQQNRLIAVSNPTTKLDWSCTYDVLGNRVSVTTNGVTTTRVMLPGALPSVAAEYQNNKFIRRHIVVGATQIADIDAAGHSNYYHGDLIGSTRLITDQTGATVNRLSYKAFGEVRSSVDATPSSRQSSTVDATPSSRHSPTAGYVGTLGVETDSTGLLFMRNRYYDPQLGRFLQRDPIGLSGGDVNWYRYCGNEPAVFVDLDGLEVRSVSAGQAICATAGILAGETFKDGARRYLGYYVALVDGSDSIGYLRKRGEMAIGLGRAAKVSGMLNLIEFGIHAVGFGVDVYDYGLGEGSIRTAERLENSSFKPWVKLGMFAGESVAKLVQMFDKWKKNSAGSTIRIGQSSGGCGGGTIMDADDWLAVMKSGGMSATYSLGDDIYLPFMADYQLKNFTGTINGNGHILSGPVVSNAVGATFMNVQGLDVWTAVGCKFENCVNLGVSGDGSKGCKFTNCEGYGYVTEGSEYCDCAGMSVHAATNSAFSDCINLTVEASNRTCSFTGCKGEVWYAHGGTFTDCIGLTVKHADEGASFSGAIGDLQNAEDVSLVACSGKVTDKISNSTISNSPGEDGPLYVHEADNCKFNECRQSNTVLIGLKAEDCEFTNCEVTDNIMVKTAYNSKFMKCTGRVAINLPKQDGFGAILGSGRGCVFDTCTITGTIVGDDSIGGIVGSLTGADNVISNCSVDVQFTARDGIGGLAHSLTKCVVSSCTVKGMVNRTDGSTFVASDAGGLVHYAKETTILGSSASLVDASSNGQVVPQVDEAHGISFVGGSVVYSSAIARKAYTSKFDNCQGTVAITDSGSDSGLGGIVYCGEDCSLIACRVAGSITGGSCVGGLAGKLQGTANIVSNCLSEVNVTGTGSNVGGVIGAVFGGRVWGAVAKGAVSGGTGENCKYIGGLIGDAASTEVCASFALGEVSGKAWIGGVIGHAKECVVSDSAARGDVVGETYVGGFFGQSENCTVSGSQSEGDVTGGYRVGGFVGDMNDGSASKCSAKDGLVQENSTYSDDKSLFGGFVGNVRGTACQISGCAASSRVTAGASSAVGGFAGEAGGSTRSTSSLVIEETYANGAVEGGNYVAGFAGKLSSCTVRDCYAAGTVTSKGMQLAAGTQAVTSYAGGFAGSGSSLNYVAFQQCYAAGKVTAPKANTMSLVMSYTGGLTPYMYQTEAGENCYWNKTSTGQTKSGVGTGITAGTKTGSFSGFDFSDVWSMGSKGPYLTALGETGKITQIGPDDPTPEFPTEQMKLMATPTIADSQSAPVVYSAMMLAPSQNAVSRLELFDSYELVKGYDYSFLVAPDGGAAVSVSGLPDGLVFADGCVTGKVSATGTSSVTITAGGETKTVTFEVIDAPMGFAAQYESAGGVVSEEEDPDDDPGEDPGGDEPEMMRSVTLTLAPGWNWISLNVVPTDASIGAVFAGVTFADEDVVKSAEGVATYSGGKWYGELTTIKPGVAYMVKKSTAGSQTLTVTGEAAETAVAVKTGWNWIGPTVAKEILLDALTHSGGFTDEDVIKSADSFATYAGDKWYGELKSLKPGVGYKAKFAKGGVLTFGK